MSKTISLISPVDGSIYAERQTLSQAEAEAAVQNARTAQPGWAALPLQARIDQVDAAVAALNQMKDKVVTELAWQIGRPVRYGGEFGGMNERSGHMAKIAAVALAPTVVERSASLIREIRREPVGTVFVIAPWNYPFMTAMNTIVPALIAGNAVILKHASQTLLAGERIAQAMEVAGLPRGLFQNLVLEHDTTEKLISARSFGFVNFTGSVAGGRAIERAAAGTFTATGLELGGKDPGYVRADADLDKAVDGLMDGAMFNSGQCCCGIERIYVHESLYDAFVARSVDWVLKQKLGNPLEQSTTMGPMAHRRFANLIRDQIREAAAAGAQLMIDPAAFPADDGGCYLAPQILTNVTHDMRIMREESFGPVVGIMPVRDDDDAVALMNDCDYGLTASVWTADMQSAQDIGARLETGTVFMNRCDYLDPALCWTGCKDTGRGAALSALGYLSLTRPKSYHLKQVTT